VLEIILRSEAEADVYSLTNKERCEELVEYRTVSGPLADECRTLAVRAWRALGCVDAGRVDLRADDQGRLMVMELNPLAGLHPEHSDLPMVWTASGRQYVDLIGRIVLEACKRNGLHPPAGAKVAGAR
jgi:D-alanine-D-alanine ligase